MIPVHQTILGPPRGNCFQAAVASILELELDDVPAFAELYPPDAYKTGEAGTDWLDAMQEFLEPMGLWYVEIVVPAEENRNLLTPLGWHILTGGSPRGDYGHSVVAFNGEPRHDPHPGDGALRTHATFGVFVARHPERCR